MEPHDLRVIRAKPSFPVIAPNEPHLLRTLPQSAAARSTAQRRFCPGSDSRHRLCTAFADTPHEREEDKSIVVRFLLGRVLGQKFLVDGKDQAKL